MLGNKVGWHDRFFGLCVLHLLHFKQIAKAQAGDDTFGEGSNFFSQSCDVDIYGTVKHKYVAGPHFVDEFLP